MNNLDDVIFFNHYVLRKNIKYILYFDIFLHILCFISANIFCNFPRVISHFEITSS